MAQTLDPWFLSMLVCPESKAPLVHEGDYLYSTDPITRRRYSIVEGIPKMLIDESQVVLEDEFNRVMRQHQKF